jgi:hypothetical protein
MSGLVRTAFARATRRPCRVHGVATQRPFVIHAPGVDSSPIIEQNAGGSYSASQTTPSSPPTSSGHPYAALEGGFENNGESSDAGQETLPSPPAVPAAPRPLAQHPFDTHAFVNYLEKSELSPKAARALMESTRQMIVTRCGQTKNEMLHKEDMENVS